MQRHVPTGALFRCHVGGRTGADFPRSDLTHQSGRGGPGQDKNLNPLNSDFDLYIVGNDGETKLPLTPKVSHDDVVRALDGRFVGLAGECDP